MAADEVMLESAAAGRPSLRFYRWSEPTLSLGYFQPESVRRTDPRLAALPFVRRATGGAALVHDRELTYALALPAGEPWQRRGENWLTRMHRVLTEALAKMNVRLDAVAPDERRKLGEVLCFLDQTPGDLLSHGHKVVGSAQRKHRAALLQHGAVLLAQSEYTPALPGLHELTGSAPDGFEAVEGAAVETLADETGWRIEPAGWTESENARREELIASKYASPVWNAKR
jgi:lipoate-protein ligase A